MKKKMTALLLCLTMTGVLVFSVGCDVFDTLVTGKLTEPETAETVNLPLDVDLQFGNATKEETDTESSAETEATVRESISETLPIGSVFAYDVSAVVESAMPAMVSIAVVTTASVDNLFGSSYTYEAEASGSGIILAEDESYLYIMTNNHVVEGAKSIKVTFVDGETYDAQVKGTDSSYDLAVVLVELATLSDETHAAVRLARIGDSRTLRLGEGAVAIGNALGYGQSVTAGIISATERQVEMDDGTLSVPLIQTDAAINPGNSGGALLNHEGEVVGINSMKFASTEVEGTGFAIPISDAIPILEELIRCVVYDENERGLLGVAVFDVTDAHMTYYNMPAGIYVQTLTEGGAAHAAGMKAGDIICAVNGRALKSSQALVEFLSRHTGGDEITVTVKRQSDTGEYFEATFEVILTCQRDEAQEQAA